MVDIFIPIARRVPLAYGDPRGVIGAGGNHVILRRGQEITDLSQLFGGRHAKPRQPVVVVGPDGRTPIVVVGAGVTEVAELEDNALAAFARAKDRLNREYGSVIPFEEYRARHGIAPKKDFDKNFRLALLDRIERHRRNPVSDPPRDPRSAQFAKGQSQITMPEKKWETKD